MAIFGIQSLNLIVLLKRLNVMGLRGEILVEWEFDGVEYYL